MSRTLRFCGWLLTWSLIPGGFVTVWEAHPLCAATFQNAADEAVLRAFAESYYSSWATKDLEGIMRLWSRRAPELESHRQAMRRFFADHEKIEVKTTTVVKMSVEGDRASLQVDVETNAVEAKSGRNAAGLGVRKQVMECVREDSGWRVWREESVFDELAGMLVAAATEQERETLLASRKDLWSEDLTYAISTLGIRLASKGASTQAITAFSTVKSLAERLGNRSLVAGALNNLGLMYSIQGDYEQAIENLQNSLHLAEALQEGARMAQAYNNLGSAYQKQGRYSLALEAFKNSLQAAQSKGNRLLAAQALGSIGNIHNARGSYGLAAEAYQKSLASYRESGSLAGEARVLNSLGNIQASQGNFDLALEFLKQSLALKEKEGTSVEQARTLENLGQVHFSRGEYDLAEDYLRRSQVIYEAAGAKGDLVSSLLRLGDLYLARRDHSRALEYFQRSLEMCEAIGARAFAGTALAGLAEVNLLQGTPELALESSERSGKISDQIDSLELRWIASTAEGKAYRGMNRPAQARAAFERALTTIEDMRTLATGGAQELQGFLGNKVSPYHELIGLLIDQGRPGEALSYAERSRARVLLDVLQGGKTDVHETMAAGELEQELKLKEEITSLNVQLTRAAQSDKPDSEGISNLSARLREARFNYEAFRTSLYARHPDLKVRRGEAPIIKSNELLDLLPDTAGALLEYVVTRDRSFLFVVTRAADGKETEVQVYVLPLKREELDSGIEAFRQQLGGRNLGFRADARRLYDVLLKPAQEQLRGRTKLVIVPDDKLWELPFQALLFDGNRYLIETSAVSYAPSLTVLREMRKEHDGRSPGATASDLLALGDPDIGKERSERPTLTLRDEKLGPLPEAKEEVRALGRLYGMNRSRIYVGAEASEDRAKNEAGLARILHFATHGILNNTAPMYSHLVLAEGKTNEDGLLEAWELMQLDLRADLAVLSACETARGRFGAGEGMIGLTWALFVAGVPTTVVSLWQVESASTRELMVSFHEGLKARSLRGMAGASKAEALRQAEVKLLKSAQTSHPFYWAGFVLVGDGR
jgi:CHAT domain-containing protein/Tfp pilus assembly protein PilF